MRPTSQNPSLGNSSELIHVLNQRYYQQWLRAEQLEAELRRIRSKWWGPFFRWGRFLKQCFITSQTVDQSVTIPIPNPLQEASELPTVKISIIIPFRDRLDLLRNCLRGIRQTVDVDFELLLVDNDSRDPRVRRFLRRMHLREQGRWIPSPGEFNFAKICNQAARIADGDYLLFLNNDIEVLHPDWLTRMLALAVLPEVGIVGATLLYPDHTIQHAGIYPLENRRWIHVYRGQPGDFCGIHNELTFPHEVPAVTGACLLTSRSLFTTLGGFNEDLPMTYNDVDLCVRTRLHGKRIAITPHARLVHYESLSRGFGNDCPGEVHLRRLQIPI